MGLLDTRCSGKSTKSFQIVKNNVEPFLKCINLCHQNMCLFQTKNMPIALARKQNVLDGLSYMFSGNNPNLGTMGSPTPLEFSSLNIPLHSPFFNFYLSYLHISPPHTHKDTDTMILDILSILFTSLSSATNWFLVYHQCLINICQMNAHVIMATSSV